MDKCIPVSQKDKCPNGQVDAKCVPYTGPNLPNINTVSGTFLDVILSNINLVIGGGSNKGLKIVTVNLNTDGSYSQPEEGWLIGIAINPSSDLLSFKMGITFGGSELIYDQFIEGAKYSTFNSSYYIDNSVIFHFGGITSFSTIKLLML